MEWMQRSVTPKPRSMTVVRVGAKLSWSLGNPRNLTPHRSSETSGCLRCGQERLRSLPQMRRSFLLPQLADPQRFSGALRSTRRSEFWSVRGRL